MSSPKTIEYRKLDNGLTLIFEPMPGVKSAAMSWLFPVGSAADPAGAEGAATLLSEWVLRGAGDLDARGHSEALDRLGVQRACRVEGYHTRLSATMIGTRTIEALPLLTDIVLRPQLTDDHLEPARDLALQALDSLKDEPQHRVMLNLKKEHFPPPFDRSGMGTIDDITSVTADTLRSHWLNRAVPTGSTLGFAGDIDPDAITATLNELLTDWHGSTSEPEPTDDPTRQYVHEPEESAQTHIAVAHDAPPEPDDDSILQRVATAALSGGMAGRLFTEVREKRSLCYSVSASYAAGRDRGAILAYVGTTPKRAQEANDVLIEQLGLMAQGIDEDEFARAVVGLKSRLVMHGESTAARAAALVHDHFVVGRARSLDELAARLEAVTLPQINDFLAAHPAEIYTTCSIGPDPLKSIVSQ
ncbi:MAG: insulinase family protein [Planctomycetes bacterium]|nr:insulinase family protein [Planctomycetota bacterium]NOG55523.1 insulinase family protein [Planctomycetota bacterium]